MRGQWKGAGLLAAGCSWGRPRHRCGRPRSTPWPLVRSRRWPGVGHHPAYFVGLPSPTTGRGRGGVVVARCRGPRHHRTVAWRGGGRPAPYGRWGCTTAGARQEGRPGNARTHRQRLRWTPLLARRSKWPFV